MNKLFKNYWNGKIPLVKSYWIGCILIPIALMIPILPAMSAERVSDGYALFTIIWWFAMFVANIYLLIGGFKSATLYVKEKKRRKRNSGWGIAAQILIIFGAISTVFNFLKTKTVHTACDSSAYKHSDIWRSRRSDIGQFETLKIFDIYIEK